MPHVVVRVDVILNSGKDDPDHLAYLETMLSKLSTAGVKLCSAKCLLMHPEVTHCGYPISGDGIQTVAAKFDARMRQSQRMPGNCVLFSVCSITTIGSYLM